MSIEEIDAVKKHAIAMSAARSEFAKVWAGLNLSGLFPHEHARIELLCWTTFLHGKGLK